MAPLFAVARREYSPVDLSALEVCGDSYLCKKYENSWNFSENGEIIVMPVLYQLWAPYAYIHICLFNKILLTEKD